MLRSREGSRNAIEQLLTRWQPRLWRYALRLTGREDAAWDVLQETRMSITQGIRRLDDPVRFRRWAYTILTRRATDWRRRNARAVPSADLHEVAGDDRLPDPPANVAMVREAVARLPADRQALLALHYREEFEIWEMAEILSIPEGTVKSRLFHARRQLREIIERMQP